LPRAARFRLQRVARLREVVPDADAGAARRRDGASAPGFDRHRLAGAERRDHGVSLEGSTGAEGPHHQPSAHLPEAAPAGVSPTYCVVDGGPPSASLTRAARFTAPRRGWVSDFTRTMPLSWASQPCTPKIMCTMR